MLSCCAESMKEQVFTMTTSAWRGVIGDLNAVFQERTEHDFGIDQILGAAKGNQSHADGLGRGIAVHQRPFSLPSRTGRGNRGEPETSNGSLSFLAYALGVLPHTMFCGKSGPFPRRFNPVTRSRSFLYSGPELNPICPWNSSNPGSLGQAQRKPRTSREQARRWPLHSSALRA